MRRLSIGLWILLMLPSVAATGHDYWDNDWEGVAIAGMIMGTIMLVAIVVGLVFIVRAIAARNGSQRPCPKCGLNVRPGNTNCPTCDAEMNWT